MGDVTILVQVPGMAAMPVLGEAEFPSQNGSLFEAVLAETATSEDAKASGEEAALPLLPIRNAILPHLPSEPLALSGPEAPQEWTNGVEREDLLPVSPQIDEGAGTASPDVLAKDESPLEDLPIFVELSSGYMTTGLCPATPEGRAAPPLQTTLAEEQLTSEGSKAAQPSAYAALWQFKMAQEPQETTLTASATGLVSAELAPRFAPMVATESHMVPRAEPTFAVAGPSHSKIDMPILQTMTQLQELRGLTEIVEVEPTLTDLARSFTAAEWTPIRDKTTFPQGEILSQMDALDAANALQFLAAESASLTVGVPTGQVSPRLSAFDVVQTMLNGQSVDRILQVSDVVAVSNQQADVDAVELRLDPEELGRLRISLRSDGDVIQVSVTAERPETLDLLRRHSERLMQELQAAGYEGAKLDFGSWHSGQEQARKPLDDLHLPEVPSAMLVLAAADQRLIHHSGSGLNLRL